MSDDLLKNCFPRAANEQFTLVAELTKAACSIMTREPLSPEEAAERVVTIYEEVWKRTKQSEGKHHRNPEVRCGSIMG